jgi:hypothetical protein
MSQPASPTAKVVFRVAEEDGSANVETLWAFDLGENRYRLDNSPFYAYSVSVGDVVFAPVDPTDGRPTFKSVLEKSGNRTVRIILDPPLATGNSSDSVVQELLSLAVVTRARTQVIYVLLFHRRQILQWSASFWPNVKQSGSTRIQTTLRCILIASKSIET